MSTQLQPSIVCGPVGCHCLKVRKEMGWSGPPHSWGVWPDVSRKLRLGKTLPATTTRGSNTLRWNSSRLRSSSGNSSFGSAIYGASPEPEGADTSDAPSTLDMASEWPTGSPVLPAGFSPCTPSCVEKPWVVNMWWPSPTELEAPNFQL